MKALRSITGLGMIDVKQIMDNAPSTIKEMAPRAEALEAKDLLTMAGATVELK